MTELAPDFNKNPTGSADNAAPVVVKDQHESLKKKFGSSFPQLNSIDGKEWRIWIESKRKEQEPILRDKRLHWSRHRHFRNGHQWISTRDGRLWREPQSDVNDLRPVLNVVGPALNFRLGILAEQRPGFRHEPMGGTGVESRETAEAQQAVSEYYFHYLKAWQIFLDAWFHSQTDGVCFIQVFVDKNAGPSREDIHLIAPTDERYLGLQAQGYTVRPDGLLELPYQDEGVPAEPDAEARMLFDGELSHRLILAHEVLFSPEARTINGPAEPSAKWGLVRRMRSVEEARIETGDSQIDSEMTITSQSDVLDMPMDRSMGWQRGLPPFPSRRQRITEGVPEYLLYIRPDQHEPGLEKGKWLRIVGNKYVEGDEGEGLPGGIIPLARMSDGSPDTDIFPRPDMSDWIGDQVSINALLGALLKHARYFAGGRMLATKNTVLEETYSSIVGSVVEYQGLKPEYFAPGSASPDAWKLLDWLIKKLEDKTGWNDIARGQISESGSAQDVSGRAVLAAQQLFERTFGPVVRAAADGATEWAHIIVRYAQYLFDEPRLIPAVGGRGDLAKMLSREQLGDRPVVYVDPETLMPMPRALKQQLLEDQLDKGRITLATYQSRSVYADVKDLQMGEIDQWQRAQWINTMLQEKHEEYVQIKTQEFEKGQMLDPTADENALYAPNIMPILWQDDANTHKVALMELISDDRKPWGLRALAIERWGIYDQLLRSQIDVTGQTQIPVQVTGVPPDRQLAPPPAEVSTTQLSMPTQGGGKPSGLLPGSIPMATPAPNSGSVAFEGEKNSAPGMGGFGNVERGNVAAEGQQA